MHLDCRRTSLVIIACVCLFRTSSGLTSSALHFSVQASGDVARSDIVRPAEMDSTRRGIVFSCPKGRTTESTTGSWKPSILWNGFAASVRLLRKLGCTLPVYNMLFAQELENTLPMCHTLNTVAGDVHCLPMREPGMHGYGYSKVFAVHDAPLDQIIFADCDAFFVKDPTYLFEEKSFVALGSLFWGDIEGHFASDSSRYSAVAANLPADRQNAFKQNWWGLMGVDSGIFLLDKAKSEKPLSLLLDIIGASSNSSRQLSKETLGNISMGDKDLWHFAWLAAGPACTSTSCFLESTIGVTGSCLEDQQFHMSSQAKLDSLGKVVALHQVQHRDGTQATSPLVIPTDLLSININGRSQPKAVPGKHYKYPNDLYFGFHAGGVISCKTMKKEFGTDSLRSIEPEMIAMIDSMSQCWHGRECPLM
mmetsp:Transcript_64043/g.119000  ORF Transcript_64043/g.119000 Transcript_64043/m.119000 type:complete len:421 (+) Transcript_64043:57-1319(+)